MTFPRKSELPVYGPHKNEFIFVREKGLPIRSITQQKAIMSSVESSENMPTSTEAEQTSRVDAVVEEIAYLTAKCAAMEKEVAKWVKGTTHLSTMSVEDEILHATEEMWQRKQLDGAARCKKFELDHWRTREEIAAMSDADYLKERFYDPEDKKGRSHWRNMIASIMQSDKSTAGKSFEDATISIAERHGVDIAGQVWIDSEGMLCARRGRDGVHKIDGYISKDDRPSNMRECYIISQKTTLRERWNQDVWCTPLCIKLVILTREEPNAGTLSSIRNHGAVVVYPNAPITEYSWPFAEFLRRMKAFQDSGRDT
jgi:predicted transposase YbfD/YdcC